MSASSLPLRDSDPTTVRRALAHALHDYLDASRVRDAVVLWHQQFDGQGTLFLGLSRYARQIARQFGLAGKEAELHLKMFRALQTDPRRLPDDPLTSLPFESTEPGRLPAGTTTLPRPLGEGAAVLQAFYAALEAEMARDLHVGLTPADLFDLRDRKGRVHRRRRRVNDEISPRLAEVCAVQVVEQALRSERA